MIETHQEDLNFGDNILTLGNAVAGNAWGPGYHNFDLSLSKMIRIREEIGLKLRLNAFNAFNTPHFQQSQPDLLHR